MVMMARLSGVDRHRFYEWEAAKTAPPTPRAARMNRLVDQVTVFHEASDGAHGSRRIWADLGEAGWAVSRKTVAKAMRQADVQGISPRTWHPATTVPGPDRCGIPDLVRRRSDMGGKDMAWFSDITYP